ncbi:MAG: hypothetical protein V4530_11000 [Pseudomonadota bacterium]
MEDRRTIFWCAILALSLLLASPLAAKPAPTLEVRNIATDWLTFWDATKGQPTPERVAVFKRDVASKFSAFYAASRFSDAGDPSKQDARIARAIDQFAPIRDAYAAKVAGFAAASARNNASFLRAFPDFRPAAPVWLLHGLGEMDGGTRELGGTSYLIFAADGMVRFHGAGFRSESAFFHHELFHLYHEPRLGPCEAVWCSLWIEGLATHVAKVLNPDGNEAELLLNLPDDMAAATRAKLLPSLQALKPVLMSRDEGVYSELFQNGDGKAASGLPLRRGYYLGYLVAQEIGKTHSLRAMATMPAAQAKPLVEGAVQALTMRALVREIVDPPWGGATATPPEGPPRKPAIIDPASLPR